MQKLTIRKGLRNTFEIFQFVFSRLRRALLTLTLISTVTVLEGQQIALHIPTSPQAEAFQKYGDYSVNFSTGVPDISIPLYEINHRGYKIPLALKYNPVPLKPGYNYDVYGHGWGLSLHSCVSRSIEFCPDEWRDFKIQTDKFEDYYYYPTTVNINDYNFAHDKFNVVLPNGSSFDFNIDKSSGQLNYSVSEGRNVKINCNYDYSNINSFEIIDEEGVKYTFVGSDKPFNRVESPFSSSFVSWQLTRIDLPYSKEPIIFSYNYSIESPLACSEPSIKINDRHVWVSVGTGTPFTKRWPIAETIESGVPYSYRMNLLSSISYGSTNINLIYHNQSSPTTYNYVDEIEIRDNSALKEIILDKSLSDLHFNCTSGIQVAKLNSLTIKSSGAIDQVYKFNYQPISIFSGTDHWGYLNMYDTEHDVANLNLFVGFDPEYYYSDVLSRTSLSVVPKSTADLGPYYKVKLSRYNNDNRRPADPTSHGVLSRLTYPTGGYTEFEFENHKFLTSTDGNGNYIYDPKDKRLAFAGGFRIKKIKNYTAEGIVAKVMSYKYGPQNIELYGPSHESPYSHTGIGLAVVDPNILTYTNFSYYFPSPQYSSQFLVRNMLLGLDPFGARVVFANPFEDIAFYNVEWEWECSFSPLNFRRIVGGRTPVVYSDVTVYNGDIDDSPGGYAPEKTAGKTVYKYDLTEPGVDLFGNQREDLFFEELYYNRNTIDYIPKSYRYNKLKEQLDYKTDGFYYTLVKKETNNWKYYFNVVTEYLFDKAYPDLVHPEHPILPPIREFLQFKQTYFGQAQLSSKLTETFPINSSAISLEESYLYNSRNQLDTKTIINSDKKKTSTIFNYPQYSYPQETTPEIIRKMVDKNIISPVIESTTQVNDKVISGVKVNYNEFTVGSSSLLLPAQSYELEITSSGSQYVLKDELKQYTANGNPLDFAAKDGIKSGIIWGYNDKYMVVKVDGKSYNDIPQTIRDAISGYSFSGGTGYSSINADITWLKTQLGTLIADNTCKVTFYTYAPPFGITSQTDTNGITTYYEYDSFGRLKYVRDNKGNILNTYEYHYQNQ